MAIASDWGEYVFLRGDSSLWAMGAVAGECVLAGSRI